MVDMGRIKEFTRLTLEQYSIDLIEAEVKGYKRGINDALNIVYDLKKEHMKKLEKGDTHEQTETITDPPTSKVMVEKQ